MAINASATARAYETSNAACVMPVALPDLWQNNDIARAGETILRRSWEPRMGSGAIRTVNSNGWMDPGSGNTVERELWEFDPGVDVYDADNDGQGDYGYGTDKQELTGRL